MYYVFAFLCILMLIFNIIMTKNIISRVLSYSSIIDDAVTWSNQRCGWLPTMHYDTYTFEHIVLRRLPVIGKYARKNENRYYIYPYCITPVFFDSVVLHCIMCGFSALTCFVISALFFEDMMIGLLCGVLCALCLIFSWYAYHYTYRRDFLYYYYGKEKGNEILLEQYYRSYYTSFYYKLLHAFLFTLLLFAFGLIYYDPAFAVNNEKFAALYPFVFPSMYPYAVKMSTIATSVVMNCDPANLAELEELLITLSNMYRDIRISDVALTVGLAYILLYVLVLFPKRYLMYTLLKYRRDSTRA